MADAAANPRLFVQRLQSLARQARRSPGLDAYPSFWRQSIASWQHIPRRPTKPPWDDPLVALVTTFDLSSVSIANFHFMPQPLDEVLPGLHAFMQGMGFSFYIVAGSHDLESFNDYDLQPSPMGLDSSTFMACLLVYAEYLTQITQALTPEEKGKIAARYRQKMVLISAHPLWERLWR